MAMTEKTPNKSDTRKHFEMRLAGLTGLLIAVAGLIMIFSGVVTFGIVLLILGLLPAGAALVFEIKRGLDSVLGQRGAFGANVLAQVLLVTLLLAGLNVFSYLHYQRFDWTRNRQFTIKPVIRDQLAALRTDLPTTIVLYQKSSTFGPSERADNYDFAAENKVVEKVRDLVDQFRELGPKFKVVVLDSREPGYQNRKKELEENVPELKESALRDSIDKAPESSIFFYSGGKVQRLGFQDIYQLDKQASELDNEKQGNLVLLDQGVEPFARRILNIDEKKPRIAVGVIHELLSTEGDEDSLTMAGVKKALAARGFDTRDVILKKWNEVTPPEPAAFTADESKYERLEGQLAELDESIKGLSEEIKDRTKVKNLWKTTSLDELTKKFADQLRGRKFTEAMRSQQLMIEDRNLAIFELLLGQQREEREALVQEKAGLNVDSLAERRRIADLKAKTERMLADCDLLILPRMTLFNVARGDRGIPNLLYRLDAAQLDAVKEFLKAGKPVLFCLGPANESPNSRDPFGGGPDALESELEKLGIKLPRQTVLFNVESKSFGERRSGLVVLGASSDPPPVEFDWKPGTEWPRVEEPAVRKLNPICESMRITERGVEKEQLDIRLRHPRPVYFEPKSGDSLPFDPVFMVTHAHSWNEDQPFPTRERAAPRFEAPKMDDPNRGKPEEKRRGPFPIGVAVPVTLPADWYSEKNSNPANVRVAVIGHGGVFIGKKLAPAREKLLLDVSNWLLGRDDLLARDNQRWQYPRVYMGETGIALWHWSTLLGLPALFAFLGLVVMMERYLR